MADAEVKQPLAQPEVIAEPEVSPVVVEEEANDAEPVVEAEDPNQAEASEPTEGAHGSDDQDSGSPNPKRQKLEEVDNAGDVVDEEKEESNGGSQKEETVEETGKDAVVDEQKADEAVSVEDDVKTEVKPEVQIIIHEEVAVAEPTDAEDQEVILRSESVIEQELVNVETVEQEESADAEEEQMPQLEEVQQGNEEPLDEEIGEVAENGSTKDEDQPPEEPVAKASPSESLQVLAEAAQSADVVAEPPSLSETIG